MSAKEFAKYIIDRAESSYISVYQIPDFYVDYLEKKKKERLLCESRHSERTTQGQANPLK